MFKLNIQVLFPLIICKITKNLIQAPKFFYWVLIQHFSGYLSVRWRLTTWNAIVPGENRHIYFWKICLSSNWMLGSKVLLLWVMRKVSNFVPSLGHNLVCLNYTVFIISAAGFLIRIGSDCWTSHMSLK